MGSNPQDCREHGRSVEYWCTQDQQLVSIQFLLLMTLLQVCSDCMVLGLHQGHSALPAAARHLCWEHGLAREWWCTRDTSRVGSTVYSPKYVVSRCSTGSAGVQRLPGAGGPQGAQCLPSP